MSTDDRHPNRPVPMVRDSLADTHDQTRSREDPQPLDIAALRAQYGSLPGSGTYGMEARPPADAGERQAGIMAMGSYGPPERKFTKEEVAFMLKAIQAAGGGIAEAIVAFENL